MAKNQAIKVAPGIMDSDRVYDLLETNVPKPLLPGVIYGELVFWIMLTSLAVAVPGFIKYLVAGGYFNSTSLLAHLWQGCDCSTIWREVANTGGPAPWYTCLSMLSRGDMLSSLGIAITGVAAIVGIWGAFIGSLRSKMGIYTVFAAVLGVVLTLSAMGVLKLEI